MFKLFKKNKEAKKMYKVTLLNLCNGEIEETITDKDGFTGIAISGDFDIIKTEEI